MELIIMNDDTLKKFAYVNISSYRTRTVKTLENENKTPTQIANDTDIRVNHISKVLRELKECGVAECINESKRKNRIYRLTNIGQDIVGYLE
jgi:predicted transcriptional regulator